MITLYKVPNYRNNYTSDYTNGYTQAIKNNKKDWYRNAKYHNLTYIHFQCHYIATFNIYLY